MLHLEVCPCDKENKVFSVQLIVNFAGFVFFPGEKQLGGQDCDQGSWSKTSRSIQFSCGSAVPVKSPGTKFQF